MKHILATLLAIALCATAPAQTIRTLGYNSTNGQVVAAANITFTNALGFTTNAAATTRSNLGLGWTALTNTNAATALIGYDTNNGRVVSPQNIRFTNKVYFGGLLEGESPNPAPRSDVEIYGQVTINAFDGGGNVETPALLQVGAFTASGYPTTNTITISADSDGITFGGNAGPATRANLGFSTNLSTFWTATNAASARGAIGVPDYSAGITFTSRTNIFGGEYGSNDTQIIYSSNSISWATDDGGGMSGKVVSWPDYGVNNEGVTFYTAIKFTTNQPIIAGAQTNNPAGETRTNLSLPLPALTNTGNVTMMRALAGSTNTNEPFSGTISFNDENLDTRDMVISNGIILSVGTPY